ncbi:MAG: FHA domain-containing protein [Thiothrix sp.]|uniref:FHA domain-containing protein n=1 Tax=Thiothrix sp. TaxID=1032 RepID=UPI00262680C4|nr:FHA domain-containing protein [Thiothrix sp.]MDD5391800.1 FHA domain-containing protein [Thiothrix sp.]
MAKVILEVQTRGLNQYHRLEQFPVTIGRALDNDIILSDPAVSAHHLQLEQGEDGALFLQNLSSENGTSMNGHPLGQQRVQLPIPSRLLLGGRKLNLLSADAPVAETNLLKFSGFFSIISNPVWAAILLILTAATLFLEKYLTTFIDKGAWFYVSDVLLNLSVLLAFALILSVVTWLASHRWAIASAVSMASLLAITKSLIGLVGETLSYLVTSDAPSSASATLYNTVLVVVLLYLYQRWASYLRPLPAVGLALLLSSPLIILEGINWLDQITVDNEFSSEPAYNQTLSSFNLHAAPTLPLDDYMQAITKDLPSQLEE